MYEKSTKNEFKTDLFECTYSDCCPRLITGLTKEKQLPIIDWENDKVSLTQEDLFMNFKVDNQKKFSQDVYMYAYNDFGASAISHKITIDVVA